MLTVEPEDYEEDEEEDGEDEDHWHLMMYNTSDLSMIYHHQFADVFDDLICGLDAEMGKSVVAAVPDCLFPDDLKYLRVWRRDDGEQVLTVRMTVTSESNVLVIGDKIVVGSCESLFIFDYRDGEVVGPRMVTVPPRPQDVAGWYLPREAQDVAVGQRQGREPRQRSSEPDVLAQHIAGRRARLPRRGAAPAA